METSVLSRIRALQQMSVDMLRREWETLYREPSRSRNKSYLVRRLAWRLQELEQGGLSDRARARLAELAPETFSRARTPAVAPLPHDAPSPTERKERPTRDARLPTPGSVISKPYKGRELRVLVREDGYEFENAMYTSLTAIARHVTGSKNINGKLFFGLTQRSRS